MIEVGILIALFVASWILIKVNFNAALVLLILLSTLLHKEFFSIFRWDLLPVRVFMLAMILEFTRQFLVWLKNERNWSKVCEFISQPLILILIAMWIVSGVSIFFSLNLRESLLLFGFLTTMVGLGFVLFHRLSGQPEKILNLIKTYIYVMFGLSIFGVVQLVVYQKTGFIFGSLWNIPGRIARIGATFWDVNHFGAVLAALLPVLGVLILVEKSLKKRVLYALMMIPMTGMLVLTNSRSGWILAAVAFLVFLLIQLVRKWGMKGVYAITLALLLVTGIGLVEYSNRQSPFRAYIKDYFHYRVDSFNSHIFLLQGAFQVLEKYPFFGGGYGSFFEQFSQTEIAPTYFGRDPISLTSGLRAPGHSIWGETAAETGWVGLYVLIALVGLVISTMVYVSIREEDKKQSLIVSAMVSALIGWFVAGIFYSYKAEFFWLILFLYFLYAQSVSKDAFSVSKIFEFFSRSNKVPVFTLLLIGFGLILFGLGRNHMIPWDEAIYGKIAKNIANTGDWLTLRWSSSNVWYEKPPLFMWLAAASMKVFGITEFAARLPSALAGLVGVITVYLFGKRLFNKTAGFVAGLALATTTSYIYYSRNAMLDVTVTAFIILSLYFYWKAVEDRARLKNWILAGVFIGLGALTKNVVGFLPLVIIGLNEIYLLVSKQTKFNLKGYFGVLLPALAIFLPWHVAMYSMYGQKFIDIYVFYHILERGTEAIEDKGQPFWWYLTVMKVSMRIWFIALLGAVPLVLVRTFKKDKRAAFLLISFTAIFLFFSFSQSKIVWYIMPLYPIAALMVGNFIERALDFVMGRFKLLSGRVFKAFSIYTLTIFAISYVFLVRGLIYPSDLTGPEAELMKLKEEKFGKQTTFYIDKVAPPVAMFYLDGRFTGVEFSELMLRLEAAEYNEPIYYVTGESRQERIVAKFPRAIVLSAMGDHILGFLDSQAFFDAAQQPTQEGL